MKPSQPFWETKSLAELSREEWESLCDGCARCCLRKLEDEDTAEIHYTNVACRELDISSCRCKSYARRFEVVADCVEVTPGTLLAPALAQAPACRSGCEEGAPAAPAGRAGTGVAAAAAHTDPRALHWMPSTCAYRLLAEGKPLPWWHPLVSGDPETVHRAGISVRGRVTSERHVHDSELEERIVDWPK